MKTSLNQLKKIFTISTLLIGSTVTAAADVSHDILTTDISQVTSPIRCVSIHENSPEALAATLTRLYAQNTAFPNIPSDIKAVYQNIFTGQHVAIFCHPVANVGCDNCETK